MLKSALLSQAPIHTWTPKHISVFLIPHKPHKNMLIYHTHKHRLQLHTQRFVDLQDRQTHRIHHLPLVSADSCEQNINEKLNSSTTCFFLHACTHACCNVAQYQLTVTPPQALSHERTRSVSPHNCKQHINNRANYPPLHHLAPTHARCSLLNGILVFP
jgi:hypothetical protein